MSLSGILLPALIALSAAAYAVFAGRAQASRLRELRQDVSTGNLRGYLAILVVLVMILGSLMFRG